MKQLKDLSMGSNRIEEISALAHLQNLEAIYMNNNRIRNIADLGNLRQLKALYLTAMVRRVALNFKPPFKHYSGSHIKSNLLVRQSWEAIMWLCRWKDTIRHSMD